jgi:hypothetical protein
MGTAPAYTYPWRSFGPKRSMPVTANPDVAVAVPCPMASNPDGMRMRGHHVTTANPNPSTTNTYGPITGRPDVCRARSHGDHFHLWRWRSLRCNNSAWRWGGLRYCLRCDGGRRRGVARLSRRSRRTCLRLIGGGRSCSISRLRRRDVLNLAFHAPHNQGEEAAGRHQQSVSHSSVPFAHSCCLR